MRTKSYSLHKGINRPVEFKGLQAQYLIYLGVGSVLIMLLFAVLYMLKVPANVCVVLALLGFGGLMYLTYTLSQGFGAHGVMKVLARRRIPRAIVTRYLDERLPIKAIENGQIIANSGDVTVCFSLTLSEVFTLSGEQLEAQHEAWVRAIRCLPAHSIVLKQDWFIQAKFSAKEGEEEKSFLSLASDRYFRERPYMEQECFLFITMRAHENSRSTSALSSLLKGSRPFLGKPDPGKLQNFLDATEQFVRILTGTGLIQCQRLGEDAIKGKAGSPGLLERYLFIRCPGEPGMLQDIGFKGGIKAGSQSCRLFTLCDPVHLPGICSPSLAYAKYSTEHSTCAIGFASGLGPLLECNHLYSQYFFVEDAARTIRELEQKKRRMNALSNYSRGNAVARDALDTFLQEAAREGRLPVKAHFNLLVWSEDERELRDMRGRVGMAFSQIDATLKEETIGAPQIYWAGIPGNAGDFPMNDTFDTFAEQAATFINPEERYRSSVSPVGIRLGDRQTGAPVHVDLSDEPMRLSICANRNKFILGPSGSGKSFFTNHLVRTSYEQGAHIVLVDVGHSYEGLCKLVNGYYFTCSERQPLCFNPFYLEGSGFPDSEKKESIKTLLLALWKKDDEGFHRSEYVALSDALQAYYEYLRRNPGVFPCFNSFYAYVRDHFVPWLREQKVKDRDFDADNFLYVLRPYYEGGELDTLLNAREHLDLLEERFIVFELDAIKDHPILFPVVTIIIMEVFISKMRRLKGVRKVILIEEAWKAIARVGMAEYIRYLFKTIRKFYGEAIVVTQEVEDIIDSPIVHQAIINNSDCKILLDQGKYVNKFDPIQEMLGLSDKEKAQVLSLNKANDPRLRYKEVFISLGGKVSKVYRTEVSPEEYYTYTTEESEKIKVMEYARKFGSMKKGIAALVMALGATGVPQSTQAQVPVGGIIGIVLKKAITAIDLKVQEMQTQAIEQQNAQKLAENNLTQSELSAIASWSAQQDNLFSVYYSELWQIKEGLSRYAESRDILKRQQDAVQACRHAFVAFKNDPHFTPAELTQMGSIYATFLEEGTRNVDGLSLLLTGNQTQMSDGRRLMLIDEANQRSDELYRQVQAFTLENQITSASRARDARDLQMIRQLYGLP